MLADRNTKHMKLQVIYFCEWNCKMFENCKVGNLKQKVGSFKTQTDKQKVNRLKNTRYIFNWPADQRTSRKTTTIL